MAVHTCNHGIRGRDGWMLGAPYAASLAEMDSKSPQLEKFQVFGVGATCVA